MHEQLRHVGPIQGRVLCEILQIVFSLEFNRVLRLDLALSLQVGLVASQEDQDILAAL